MSASLSAALQVLLAGEEKSFSPKWMLLLGCIAAPFASEAGERAVLMCRSWALHRAAVQEA